MTVKPRGKRWTVEVYDPSLSSKKRYVGTYDGQREAKSAERVAQTEVSRRRGRKGDETVAGFAARWLDLRPRTKASTNVAYREQVKPFADRHGSTRLRE